MSDQEKYHNRDRSWLSFNYRVLLEAKNKEVPLYERIKFISIYSSNLDEFFRVRIAALRTLMLIKNEKVRKELNTDPKPLLEELLEVIQKQQRELGDIFARDILPELKKNNIHLYRGEPPLEAHKQVIKHYFRTKVLSYLQIVFLDKGSNTFLDNKALYFALRLRTKGHAKQGDEIIFAHLNIPSGELNRFVELPAKDNYFYYIFLDDLIRLNLESVFPGYQIIDCYSIKITRDADLDLGDEYAGNLIEKIKKQLIKRKKGLPVRFLYDSAMPADFLTSLTDTLQVEESHLIPGGRYHNLNDLSELPNPKKPLLENSSLPLLAHIELDQYESIFEAIEGKDHILHFPYQSYDNVLRFFNEAAIDPLVVEIRVTIYRIAFNSFIANALISAAKNKKRVVVFVEVKARFDEANNLKWAQKIKEAGIKIIYSIPGLKVHAKVALVKRKTARGKIKRFCYLSTGNFNEVTAGIYADHGLLTSHRDICKELDALFRHLHRRKKVKPFEHLMVSQFNMQECFLDLIEKEIGFAKKGKQARIIIKLNHLEDPVMIDKLYEANKAGVKIELIIRGICCLLPGVKGLSDHIRVTRLVDRFLEHARVCIFSNNGKEQMFLSSADWMKRNLYRRIEVAFPVYDEAIKTQIQQIIDLQLQDTSKAVRLDRLGENQFIEDSEKEPVRAQTEIYKLLQSGEDSAI